jgi:hypothetical protein
MQVVSADEPPNRTDEVGMVARGDDTLSRKNCLDVENETSSHLVKASKKGRMLMPGQHFRAKGLV